MSEKTEELRKSLLRAPKNGYDRISAEEKEPPTESQNGVGHPTQF